MGKQLARADEERAHAARAEAFGIYARALTAYRAGRGLRSRRWSGEPWREGSDA